MPSSGLLYGRIAPLVLASPGLIASVVLPWQAGWVCAVATIVVLGVPHGALDVEIARSLLRDRCKGWWFPLFAMPYLCLAAGVLLAWRGAPELTLATFLLASVWHFGNEGDCGDTLSALAWGGLPIAVPVLFQPLATARLLSATAGLHFDRIPDWLFAFSLGWLIPLITTVSRSHARQLVALGALFVIFVIFPPLTAFALYFVVFHAPAHMAALVRNPMRAPRVQNLAAAWWLAAPTTVLTVAIGAMLWPFFGGAMPERLLCLTMQLLAGLTLPHMMLDAWLSRRERILARCTMLRGHPSLGVLIGR